MKSVQCVPLYILRDGKYDQLVCKLHCIDDDDKNLRYIRYYPSDMTYSDIEGDIAGEFGIATIAVQTVWWLPVYTPREERPF